MRPILLAEQHAPTREHLTSALAQAGYSVQAAAEPGAAMELFVSAHPAAVVVAVDFPRLDGEHLGQRIRRDDRGSRIPLIAIDKGHLGKAKGVGAALDVKANAYVADPLKPELAERLAALLEAHAVADDASESGVQRALSRAPSVSGDLQEGPLPAFLHSLFRLQRDGILVVAYRDLTRRVFYVKGSPVHYDSTARQDGLPQFLSEKGDLTEDEAASLQAGLAGGARIGRALAEVGVALQGEELLQKLRDFTRERVAQVVGMRRGHYAFHGGNEFVDEIATVDVPALAPILEGARRTFPLRVFAQALKARLDQFPYRTAEFGRDLGALGLSTADLKIALQLSGRIVLKDLLAHGRGELWEAYTLLWYLSLAGDVKFSPTPLTSSLSPATTADILAPKRRKPLPADQAAELREAAVKIITGSYFFGLGLDITADAEAVERAYKEVSQRFHPDSYPEYDASEIQDLLDSVQDRLNASYRVLSNEEKRRAYLQYLFSRLDVGRSLSNVDAEIALKRGSSALKRRDPRTALKAFEQAVALNPREPEYATHLAWATYLAGRGDQKARAKAALKILKKVSSRNPYLERAVIISAIIEGEMGEAPAARQRLLKVLKVNPSSKLAKAALLKVGR